MFYQKITDQRLIDKMNESPNLEWIPGRAPFAMGAAFKHASCYPTINLQLLTKWLRHQHKFLLRTRGIKKLHIINRTKFQTEHLATVGAFKLHQMWQQM